MCGEFIDMDGDGEGLVLAPRTVRARAEYQCEPCLGRIAAGSYHCVIPWLVDGKMTQVRAHIQCRDVMREVGLFGYHVVRDAFQEDEERGDLALDHYVAVAEWACGLPYRREIGGDGE